MSLRKHLARLSLYFFLTPLLLSNLALPAAAEEFVDVNKGDTYYVAINYLKEAGIIEGYNDNTFRAENTVNRAEALKMITLATELFNEDEIEGGEAPEEGPFTDTPADEWFSKYLVAAKNAELINGYSDGSFRPNTTINLAETLKLIFESYGDIPFDNTEEHLYVDTPLGEWLTKYTAHAGERGIVNIYSTNTVNPSQEMTRGYLAEIIYRTIMSRTQGYHFGKATYYGAALHGNGTASGETFDMYAMTAAHKTLPFGTMVKVTNLANGEYVEVKINDRGPYGYGRVIDLSSAAFEEIASLGTGVINVQYEIILPDGSSTGIIEAVTPPDPTTDSSNNDDSDEDSENDSSSDDDQTEDSTDES